jgi:hypothetical protein
LEYGEVDEIDVAVIIRVKTSALGKIGRRIERTDWARLARKEGVEILYVNVSVSISVADFQAFQAHIDVVVAER